MASAGTVTVDFAAETAKFTAQLKQVNDRLKNVESGFKTLERVARTALTIFSVGAITAFAKSAAKAADELGKTADKIGISTAGLKTFQIAAGEAGVSIEATNKLLLESQKRLGEAAAGTGEAAKFIKLLGLNVRDLQELSPEQLFDTYSESINRLSNRSEQLAAANALMGRTARDAFNLIQAGAPAMRDAAAFVERFGLALDRVDIKQIEQANDTLGRIGVVADAAGQRIFAGLAPALEFFANTVLNATANTKELQETAGQFGAFAVTAFEIIANAARSLQAAFFGIAAGAARVLQFLTFGDVSESFAASVDANLAKANEALEKIKSIEQIQQTVTTALEDSRRRAEEAVAAQQGALAGGTDTLVGEDIGLTNVQQIEAAADAARAAADAQKQLQKEISDATLGELQRRAEAAAFWRDYEYQLNAAAARSEIALRIEAAQAAIGAVSLMANSSKTFAKIQKGIQLAMAIRDTYLGVTHQLTSGDPYTAVARAIAVGAFGFAQVKAILSTPDHGAGGHAGVSGGPALGSPSVPAIQPVDTDGRQLGATSQPVVQVIVQGNVVGNREFIDDMIDSIKDQISNNDVILIPSSSRQAQEIVVQG